MLDDKSLFGLLTIAIGIVSYSFYFKNIFNGKTKPDPFSWLIWSILAAITFFAQISRDGGPGAWATALTAVICLIIAIISYANHDGHIKKIDELSLLGAFVGIVLWQVTNDPLWAVVLAIIIGAIGFIPTFQKAFYKPGEETAITYLLNAFKFAFALLALQHLTPVTWLYPAGLTAMNASLATMLFIRRHA